MEVEDKIKAQITDDDLQKDDINIINFNTQ